MRIPFPTDKGVSIIRATLENYLVDRQLAIFRTIQGVEYFTNDYSACCLAEQIHRWDRYPVTVKANDQFVAYLDVDGESWFFNTTLKSVFYPILAVRGYVEPNCSGVSQAVFEDVLGRRWVSQSEDLKKIASEIVWENDTAYWIYGSRSFRTALASDLDCDAYRADFYNAKLSRINVIRIAGPK